MRLQQFSAIVQTASRRVRAAVDGGQPELAHIRRMMVERVLDQVVSQQHGQFTAQQRVDSLWPLFDGWVPREPLRAA